MVTYRCFAVFVKNLPFGKYRIVRIVVVIPGQFGFIAAVMRCEVVLDAYTSFRGCNEVGGVG